MIIPNEGHTVMGVFVYATGSFTVSLHRCHSSTVAEELEVSEVRGGTTVDHELIHYLQYTDGCSNMKHWLAGW